MPKLKMKEIVSIKKTCNFAPLQYEGKLSSGEEFYFRDRHGSFSFAIAKTLKAAINETQVLHFQIGKGNLSEKEAEKIIKKEVIRYMKKKYRLMKKRGNR